MKVAAPSPKGTNFSRVFIDGPRRVVAAYDQRLSDPLEALRRFLTVRLELSDADVETALKLAAGEQVDDVEVEQQPRNGVDRDRRLGMDGAPSPGFARRFPGAARLGAPAFSIGRRDDI